VTERDDRTELVFSDPEVPAEDALEQGTDAVEQPADAEPADRDAAEADEADLAEQSRAVGVDDDEYR
jgi:hypothetical protein